MKIGIAGVGGIGSNVAMHLVRSGITNLKFGDFDTIEHSNLNRQFYFRNQIGNPKALCLRNNLKLIDETGNYDSHIIKFTRENIKDFFKECDIIVDGFDKKEYKSILVEELYGSNKIILTVSGIGGKASDEVKVIKKTDRFYIVGDMESDIKEFKTYSHKVGIVAAKVAEIIIKMVM